MPVLRFSVFEMDASSGVLTRSGRRVALPPQPFAVLWLLASRAGTVVSRTELRFALWGSNTHVDFDRGLNFCIAAVRRALGDAARGSKFVETLPRHGYRFIAEVRLIEDAAPRPDGPSDGPDPAGRDKIGFSRRWAEGVLALLLMLLSRAGA
jgi:DNA-binding winged helix-turn-helix (wHTH) protein